MIKQLFYNSRLLFFVLFFTCNIPIQAQKAVSTQEQTIETKVRLNELEKKVDAQEQEIQSVSDKNKADLEVKFELKKENLEYKKGLVGWWLTVLGLLITFFGIGVPIAAIIFSRNFSKDFMKQKEKAEADFDKFKNESKENIDQFISISKEKFKLLEEKSLICITNLNKSVQDGKNAADGIIETNKEMDVLKKNLVNPDLTTKNKEAFASQAKELGNEEGITKYEKDFAKALELYFSDETQQALDKFIEIINNYPNKITMIKLAEIYFYIAYLYEKLDKLDKFLEYTNISITINPKNSDAWYNKGVYFLKIEEFKEAQIYFNKALEIRPNFENAILNLGACYRNNKDIEEVLNLSNKLVEIHPKSKEAWCNLGIYYNSIKEFDKAIESFQKGIDIDPEFVKAYCNIALSLTFKGIYDKAIEYYKIAIEKDKVKGKELSPIYTNLIETCLFANELENAKKYIAEVNELEIKTEINIFILNVLYLIMTDSLDKNADQTFKEIKELVRNDAKKINWSFEEMRNWLSSNKSSFITDDQRTLITELIRLFEEWRAENKKP